MIKICKYCGKEYTKGGMLRHLPACKARKAVLESENGKTKYWLYKQLGMSYQNFTRMVNNQTKSIRYENIETLCLLLNCTPNELFEISEE